MLLWLSSQGNIYEYQYKSNNWYLSLIHELWSCPSLLSGVHNTASSYFSNIVFSLTNLCSTFNPITLFSSSSSTMIPYISTWLIHWQLKHSETWQCSYICLKILKTPVKITPEWSSYYKTHSNSQAFQSFVKNCFHRHQSSWNTFEIHQHGHILSLHLLFHSPVHMQITSPFHILHIQLAYHKHSPSLM